MGEGNFGVLWIIAGLLAALFLGQTAWNAAGNRTCTEVYGLPSCLCQEVVAARRPSLSRATDLYNACRYGANVRSDALCALVVHGFLTPHEAARLYVSFPHVSEWEWKQLNPRTAGFMVNPAHVCWPWKTILQGRVAVGMTDTQVIAAWSLPASASRRITAYGDCEVWVYRGGRISGTRTLYFKDRVLVAIDQHS